MEEDSDSLCSLCVLCCLPIPTNSNDEGGDLLKKNNISNNFLLFCEEVLTGFNETGGGGSKLGRVLLPREVGNGWVCEKCEEFVGEAMEVKGKVDEVEGRVRKLQREVSMALKDLHKVLGEYYLQLRRIEVVVRESDGEALKARLEDLRDVGSTVFLLREAVIKETSSLKIHQDALSTRLMCNSASYCEVEIKVEPEAEEEIEGGEETYSPASTPGLDSEEELSSDEDFLPTRSRKRTLGSSKGGVRGTPKTTKASQFKRKGITSRKRVVNKKGEEELRTNDLQKLEEIKFVNNVTCQYCSRVYKARRYLRAHQRKHHPETNTRSRRKKMSTADDQISCKLCPDVKFRSIYTLEHHFRTLHDESPEKPLKCDICPAQFSCEPYLKLHTDFHQGKFKRLCDLCPHPTSFNAIELLSHIKSHGEDTSVFQCSKCSFVCSLQKTYLNHFHEHNKDLKRGGQYPCDRCPEKFSMYRMLMRHRKTVHNEEIVEHVCGIDNCTKTYFTLKTLDVHRKCHSKDGYRCKECNQDFSSGPQLLEHKANAHGGGLQCDQCSQRFPTRTALDSHLIKDHGAPKFKCDLCDKAYANRVLLNSHKKSHSTNTCFSCEECGRTYGTESLLRRHIVTHKGDKLFTCDQCGMSFKWKTGLRRHMQKHDANRETFPCDQCERSFFTREHLRVHLRIHSGEKPFICDLCGMDFRHLATFNLHKRRVHKLEPTGKKTSL